jgi:hypothetical protein
MFNGILFVGGDTEDLNVLTLIFYGDFDFENSLICDCCGYLPEVPEAGEGLFFFIMEEDELGTMLELSILA